jgi:hypothetical protein
MRPNKSVLVAAATAASLLFVAQARAEEPAGGGVKIGVLTCNVSSGWGLVFGSSKDLNCTFAAPNRTDNYVGKINKYGVDIGYQKGGVMAWAVFAPSSSLAPGSLAGSYGGATAGASAGVGANANALIGGSDKHISLQPVSVEGVVGLNIAAGVASINLTWAPS